MDPYYTPRLCIDGRAAAGTSSQGFVAQECIDQLVAGQGEEHASSEWIEKHRTVLLCHPDQIFSGQLKRFTTRRKSRSSPIHWIWEKGFVRHSNISAFHRFRPMHKLGPSLPCETITTVLPGHRIGFSLRVPKDNQWFVVPSKTDADRLIGFTGAKPEVVKVVLPSTRRYVHFTDPLMHQTSGDILILVGSRYQPKRLARLKSLIQNRYPGAQMRSVGVISHQDFYPVRWLKLLSTARMVFYLCDEPFDWPVLALESLFFGFPVIFDDGNAALSEILQPHSPLSLSRFLLVQPTSVDLIREVHKTRSILEKQGYFDPLALAKQYRKVYAGLGGKARNPVIPTTGSLT